MSQEANRKQQIKFRLQEFIQLKMKNWNIDALGHYFNDNDFISVNVNNKGSWGIGLTKQQRIQLLNGETITRDSGVKLKMYDCKDENTGYQFFLNDSNIYCLDVDKHNFNDSNVIQNLYQELSFLKSCPFTLSRTKALPHFYFRIEGIESYSEEVNIMNCKSIEADLLHRAKQPIERADTSVYCFNNKCELPTFQWDDIKQYFNVDKMNFRTTSKPSIESSNKSSTEGIQSCISQGIESSQEGTNYEGDKKKWFDLAMICAKNGRFHNYSGWQKMGQLIKNVFNDFELFNSISSVCHKYEGENNCLKYWNTWRVTHSENSLKIGSLFFWAREDCEKEFNEWKEKHMKEQNEKLKFLVERVDLDEISKYYYYKKPNQYVYKNKTWYYLDVSNRWLSDSEPIGLINDISFTIKQDLEQYLNEFVIGDPMRDKINLCCRKIGSCAKNCIDNLRGMYLDKYDNIKFDSNSNLFAFNNSVIDLKTYKNRPIQPTDYISLSAGYDYRPSTEQEREELMDIIKQIQPKKDIRDLVLKIYSTGLEGLLLQKFVILTGKGRNGKSMLTNLIIHCLGNGNYGFTGANECLTKTMKTGANPQIADMENKRLTVLREADESVPLINAVIKELTGGDTLSARTLYSKKSTINICHTMIFESNKLPPLKSKCDIAMLKRLICIPFTSHFTDIKTEFDLPNHFPVNDYYTKLEFKDKYKYAMIDILLQYYQQYNEQDERRFTLPKEVQDKTNEYVESSYLIRNFFNSTFEQIEDLVFDKTDNEQVKKLIEQGKYISLSDIHSQFTQSQEYRDMNRVEKTQANKKNFINDLLEDRKICNSYLETFYFYTNYNSVSKKYEDKKKLTDILLGYKSINN